MAQRPRKLLDQVRACPELAKGIQYGFRAVAGQCKHYAYSSEKTYVCCETPSPPTCRTHSAATTSAPSINFWVTRRQDDDDAQRTHVLNRGGWPYAAHWIEWCTAANAVPLSRNT